MKKLIVILLVILVFCSCGKEIPKVPEEHSESVSVPEIPESEEAEPEKELTPEQQRAKEHMGDFLDYRPWADELGSWAISVSIVETEFVSRTDFEAKLRLNLGEKELLIPFSGIFDNIGNIWFGTVLFPDEKTAAFCGRGEIVFFSTENLEVLDFSLEIPEFEEDDVWINGVAFDEKNEEWVLFVTPMNHREGEEKTTFALYYKKDFSFKEKEEIRLLGTYHASNFYTPIFFYEAKFLETGGKKYILTDRELLETESGKKYRLGDEISVSEGDFLLKVIPYVEENEDYNEEERLAVLYEKGIIKEALLFTENNISTYYYSDTLPPSLEVSGNGKKAVYYDDYFAMTLTFDFEKMTHKVEYNPADRHIDDATVRKESADGKYSICSFGTYGGGDIIFSHLSVRNNETAEHAYIGKTGGMYGGYGGMGFLRNNDVYIYSGYSLEIKDPETGKTKFDLSKNFPLGYEKETDSGRGLLTFRRDPENFSYIVVYYEYENGITWYDYEGKYDGHDGIGDCSYKIGFLDSEGNLIKSYDTGCGIRSDVFGICNLDMRYSPEELTLIVTENKGGRVIFEGVFDMETKEFQEK